jgi:hypothetical protein
VTGIYSELARFSTASRASTVSGDGSGVGILWQVSGRGTRFRSFLGQYFLPVERLAMGPDKKLFDSIGQSFSFGGKLQPGGFAALSPRKRTRIVTELCVQISVATGRNENNGQF